MARESRHFEQGANWKARNAASIKLRVGDGKKHPVQATSAAPPMTREEQERADGRREQVRAQLESERQAAEARALGARRESAMDARHASRDHTPPGWVPANRRGYVDPLSNAADPRPTKPLPKRKKKRRSRRELQ